MVGLLTAEDRRTITSMLEASGRTDCDWSGDYRVFSRDPEMVEPIIDYDDITGAPQRGPAVPVSGFRLVDARASYGISLATFALGFPVHFDWSWRTLMNREWEDILFRPQAAADGVSSGSEWFRKPKFTMWIGYDW